MMSDLSLSRLRERAGAKAAVSLLALALVAAPEVRAQDASFENQALPGVQAPAIPQAISLSLTEALIATESERLSGIFGFVAEELSSIAFAYYLIQNPGKLKPFVKKAKRDLEDAEAINDWDKMVFVHLVQINGSGMMPPGTKALSRKQEMQISEFVLAPAVPLNQLQAMRGRRR